MKWVLGIAFLTLVAAAVWRATLPHSAVLGISAIFALTPISSYYWVLLLSLPLAGAAGPALAFVVLNAALFGLSVTPTPVGLQYTAMSIGLAGILVVWLGRRALRRERAPDP